MHLTIPYASDLGEACAHMLGELALPRLSELLGLLDAAGAPLGGDEMSPDTPFEQQLAALRGAAPGPVPTAAWLARDLGLDATACWALLTPIHLAVGTDQVTALDPAALNLDVSESRAIFESLAELWPEGEGWLSHWVAPTQWLIAHPRLAGVRAASLDRVVQRGVEPWLPEARALRTLQNEIQMLLHRNPHVEALEAAGRLAPNSAWVSGCGVASGGPLPADLVIDARLREALLAGDWAAWAEHWRALDAGPVAEALAAARAGRPVTLTLCGERYARTYQLPQRSGLKRLWQGIIPPRAETAAVLEAL